MLVSLNWIRDFVDLPGDLDPLALAETFTRTTAEVDAVEREGDDWIIDIDNKSLTNRPDLWGHYGIAREIAAILRLPLKPYPGVPVDELSNAKVPTIPIAIADASACRRYSGLIVEGVPTQPAPRWMQARLERVGLRPISGLVDLTNYIMADLGQPMHAFDADKVDRIEVDWAKDGERFRTLDGVERSLSRGDLMIQCGGTSVALAGVMGGLETEVSPATRSLLLESANFDGAVIRRTAKRLGLRSEASARFEKSLDPANTVLAIQRFIQLARPIYPKLKLTSRLSDGYPNPIKPVTVSVNPRHVAQMLGREVVVGEAERILEPLGFEVTDRGTQWSVRVPGYRATGDISIEADVIEELARRIGYDSIRPALPQVTVRSFAPNALHELEQRTLEYLTGVYGFHEIHGYPWYDSAWLAQLGVDPGPCVEVMNPAADGLNRLRRSLMPGLLAAVAKNRFHFPALSLLEIGSVFEVDAKGDREFRHLALVLAQRGKGVEDELLSQLKGAIAGWTWQRFGRSVCFTETRAAPQRPWEHPHRIAEVLLDGASTGRVSVIDMSLRRAADEHLAAWGIAWAELRLSGLEGLSPVTEKLGTVPPFPLVEMDFSIVVVRTARYADVVERLGRFDHPLLKMVRFVTSYEGEPVPQDRRSLTFRAVLGDADRTLTDADASEFRAKFEDHLRSCGFDIRTR